MVGDPFSHTRSPLDVSYPFGSFNRKCRMWSDKIGVALVEVKVVIQHILAFRKTDTFPDQSRDSMPMPEPIAPTFAVFGRGGPYEMMGLILWQLQLTTNPALH